MFLGIVVLVIYFFLYLVNKLICMDDDMLIYIYIYVDIFLMLFFFLF